MCVREQVLVLSHLGAVRVRVADPLAVSNVLWHRSRPQYRIEAVHLQAVHVVVELREHESIL